MLARKLYRILRKSSKPMLLVSNKEFLLSTVSVFQSELMEFSGGQSFVQRLRSSPLSAIQRAFREGSVQDVDKFFPLLPKLMKYFRAVRLLNGFSDTISHSETNDELGDSQLRYDLKSGALLVSKLNYSDKELKTKDLDQQFDQMIDSMIGELRTQVRDVMAEERLLALSDEHESDEERQRSQIFLLLLALDRMIKNREAARVRGAGYVHLVDQVVSPEREYFRATPIIYSSMYCTLVNKLNLAYQAFGVANPKHFLSKIQLKHAHSVINEPLLKNLMTQFDEKAKSMRLSFSFQKEVHVRSIPGRWMRVKSDRSFDGIQLKFDKSTSVLAAYRDWDPSLPLWQLQLTVDSRPTNIIKIGHDYIGDYRIASALAPEGVVIPCTIKFHSLNPELIADNRDAFHIFTPYLEIEISYREKIRLSSGTDSDVPVEFDVDMEDRLCRMSDVDWCLLSFSDTGVSPITPVKYFEHLKRQGRDVESGRAFLRPVTSALLAARMAGNIARNGSDSDEEDKEEEHSRYWSAISRQLASFSVADNPKRKFSSKQH